MEAQLENLEHISTQCFLHTLLHTLLHHLGEYSYYTQQFVVQTVAAIDITHRKNI